MTVPSEIPPVAVRKQDSKAPVRFATNGAAAPEGRGPSVFGSMPTATFEVKGSVKSLIAPLLFGISGHFGASGSFLGADIDERRTRVVRSAVPSGALQEARRDVRWITPWSILENGVGQSAVNPWACTWVPFARVACRFRSHVAMPRKADCFAGLSG